MNIKNFAILSIILLFSSSIFAKDKSVVLFFESLDGISPKVLQKISSSDNFCFSVNINSNSLIPENIQNLIISNKIEPTLMLNPEPYFPLISSEISISSKSFDRTSDLKNLLKTYKKTSRLAFDKKNYGLFLKDAIINEDTLKAFYKNNILWTTAELEDNLQKGIFIKNKLAIFVTYTDFPKDKNQISQWFSQKDEEFIPVLLTKDYIKNDDFMLYLITFFNKSKTLETELPLTVSYTVAKDYDRYINGDNIKLKTLENIPQDIFIKLVNASNEVNSNDNLIFGKSDLYPTLYDELTNMYSYNVISKILNNDLYANKIFDISYSNIFKLAGKEKPTFEESTKIETIEPTEQTDMLDICSFIKDGNTYTINNNGIIKTFSFKENENPVLFSINADFSQLDYIDIYIDMNGIAYTGCQNMLKGIEGFFIPENCWEYAIRVTPVNIKIYRFSANVVNLLKTIDNNKDSIAIPTSILRGNPINWSYQIVAAKDGNIIDFLETSKNKVKVLNTTPLQLQMFKYIQ
ncbi:MAG: hypothetical protein PHG84_01235 [Endomicrobiaceae bacterium]|nr:hypothetical protein [Endomicrobiaceae bacterium]MDD3053006.1 hypothetical protein [Endomicrobiaceae bacterium]MDD3922142.1 hypothetical protein [Endomicrobiaceae bacterium]MDD5101399.1 hypothetical protein [Endomicrobiaceae bacterium]